MLSSDRIGDGVACTLSSVSPGQLLPMSYLLRYGRETAIYDGRDEPGVGQGPCRRILQVKAEHGVEGIGAQIRLRRFVEGIHAEVQNQFR